MARHPLLADFGLDLPRLGASLSYAGTPKGRDVCDVVLSLAGFTAVLGALDAAPSRPPQPALDRHMISALGSDVAGSDDAKILAGRVVRQAVEHVGGTLVRSNVPVTAASVFASGSIYALPDRGRGRMKAPERREWARRQDGVPGTGAP